MYTRPLFHYLLYLLLNLMGLTTLHSQGAMGVGVGVGGRNLSTLATSTTVGIVLRSGVFYPSHSIAGTDNNFSTHIDRDGTSLYQEFNSYPENYSGKSAYFQSLSALEKARLFNHTEVSTEDKNLMVDSFIFNPSLLETAGSESADPFVEVRTQFQAFLDELTEDSVFVEALNLRDPFMGPVYPNAPTSYGQASWGGLESLDLSGRDLTGLSVVGRDLRNSNLSGNTRGIFHELHLASDLKGINLAGNQNLSGFVTAGLNLAGVDLSSSNISQQQIKDITFLGGGKLRNLDFTGFDFRKSMVIGGSVVNTTLNLISVNLNGATGLSAQQLVPVAENSGAFIQNVDLRGTGLTRQMLRDAYFDEHGMTSWQIEAVGTQGNLYDGE